MENVYKLTGNWITFKDSSSDIFRIEFPLSTPRQDARRFTDITGESQHWLTQQDSDKHHPLTLMDAPYAQKHEDRC